MQFASKQSQQSPILSFILTILTVIVFGIGLILHGLSGLIDENNVFDNGFDLQCESAIYNFNLQFVILAF